MASYRKLYASQTQPDGMQIGLSGGKIGFHGATPVIKPAGVGQAIPTDLASTIVFCTKIRLDLIALGLIAGA